MNWAQLFIGMTQLLVLALTWARERELIDAGKQAVIAELLGREADAIKRASAARAAASGSVTGDRLYEDDGFRRPD